jgi:hypothetical protein
MKLDDPWLLVQAWLLAPALVVVASAGLGLLVGRLSVLRLGAMTLPVGYLTGIALMTGALQLGLTGKVVVVLAAVAAVAGGVWGALALRGRRPGRTGRTAFAWAAGGALVAFGVGMAPLAGSGYSGILGYVLNNDSAVHIVAIELMRDHGATGYQSTLDSFHGVSGNFGVGYPIGTYAWPLFANVALGLDPFHLWSPITAVTTGMLALVAYTALRTIGASPVAAAVMSPFVACSYPVLSYLSQGGGKEVATAFSIYAALVLLVLALRSGPTWRTLLPAAIAVCAAINVLGIGALAWLGPAGLVALPLALLGLRGRALAVRAAHLAAAGATAAVLALPSLIGGAKFVEKSAVEVLNDVGETGNLLAPVPWREAFGVWLTEDYRFPYTHYDVLTGIGIGIAALLAVVGVVVALRRREPLIPLAVFTGFAGMALVFRGRHGIYIDAKTICVLAPALALAAAAGVLAALQARRALQILGVTLAVALAAGMAYSDALVYAGAWVTPEERFEELAEFNDRLAGTGPILVNEREDYAKHLLRDVQPWESWGSFQPTRGLASGPVPPAIPHIPDFDDYDPRHIARFPLLLERRRPGGSRPPANYEPTITTHHYRVWERTGPPPRVHLALGNGDTRSGVAKLDCGSARVRRLVRRARQEGDPLTVAWGERISVVLDQHWRTDGFLEPGPIANFNYRRGGNGVIFTRLKPGRYEAWIEGSFGTGVRLLARKTQIGEARSDLGFHDGYQLLGPVTVRKRNPEFGYLGPDRPWYLSGSRRDNLVGPVVFARTPSTRRIEQVDADDVSRLCGEELDWIELR